MKKLILIRGLPGSGKSTLAKELLSFYQGSKNLEADMWFTDAKGDYHFQSKDIKFAHNWCQYNTKASLDDSDDAVVIVSNTFTTLWEMEPYFKIAKDHGIVPIVYLAQNRFQNVHGVPEEVLKKMRDRFEYNIEPLFEKYK